MTRLNDDWLNEDWLNNDWLNDGPQMTVKNDDTQNDSELF